ncbi:Protein kinase domain-containing protein [Nocardioides alpinus]|uniref:Protein kinase domain-containing protein n=1 Tax=Nocardioides alpinus TaxID=748909 RepID=A0A1I0WBY8_9ACTN|nr:serine/threonine-protein kinase [Nocardioides alpinus]PKH37833.1 serine/threonine protein kinase [Nocardioides alpinus]SFA86265.1 Protein kinase domain-containing protein [Nocardioides alpinus]
MSRRRTPTGDLPPGYRPLSLLADGRRLETWDAWDEARGTRCVVKLLRADRRDDARVRQAVLLEGHLATTLAHPHLVRGYDVLDDPPTVVLETLRGATLAALIDDEPLGLADAAELGCQLVSVLGYLHRHDWLHLDLKPDNVVVDHGKAVLIDLSLAGRPGAGRPGAGTRGYLAPEQARGRGLSPATDVWGLGMILVEALARTAPYGDEATWDSRRRWPLVHRRAPGAPVGLDEVPDEVRGLLRACLSPDPAARPLLPQVRDALAPLRSPAPAVDDVVAPLASRR